MKITMYELLGLVKDGKAPKKIKYKDKIWKYIKSDKEYLDTSNYIDALFSCFIDGEYILNLINNEVEIIEEPKKIGKLETYKEKEGEDYFANILKLSPNSECEIDEALSTTIDKLNELIDEINKLKEND